MIRHDNQSYTNFHFPYVTIQAEPYVYFDLMRHNRFHHVLLLLASIKLMSDVMHGKYPK